MSDRGKTTANPDGFARILTMGRRKYARQNHGSDYCSHPIQRWLVNLKTPYDINELFESPAEATETATQPPTEAVAQRPTDEEGWGRDIFRP